MLRFVPLFFLGALAATACTTTITTDDDDEGDNGTCSTFDNETALSSTVLRFRNDSGAPVYLPGGCGAAAFDITSVNDPGSATSYQYNRTCLQTCEGMQIGTPVDCSPCAPTTMVIPAGGTLDVTWNGTGLRSVTMPDSCWFDPTADGTCDQIVAAPTGTYRVQATIYSECVAFAPDGECECAQNGSCFGDPGGVSAPLAPVDVSFPSAALVEVVIDPCAFGCAEG